MAEGRGCRRGGGWCGGEGMGGVGGMGGEGGGVFRAFGRRGRTLIISPDLSICTAYLSVFPSEKGEEILKNITANEKTIRYDLGKKVRNQLRIIPELRFFLDDSLDYLERIDELLKK